MTPALVCSRRASSKVNIPLHIMGTLYVTDKLPRLLTACLQSIPYCSREEEPNRGCYWKQLPQPSSTITSRTEQSYLLIILSALILCPRLTSPSYSILEGIAQRWQAAREASAPAVPLSDCTAAARIKQRLQLLLLWGQARKTQCSRSRHGPGGRSLLRSQETCLLFLAPLLSLGKMTWAFCFLSHPLSVFCI